MLAINARPKLTCEASRQQRRALTEEFTELSGADSGLNATFFLHYYRLLHGDDLSKTFLGRDSKLVTQAKAEHESFGKSSLLYAASLHIARDPGAQDR